MTYNFMQLAAPQFQTKLQNCIRMEITIFKLFICEVYHFIYSPKSHFTTPHARCFKTKFYFRHYIQQYTTLNANFEYSYPRNDPIIDHRSTAAQKEEKLEHAKLPCKTKELNKIKANTLSCALSACRWQY